jgi:hypothetical protein
MLKTVGVILIFLCIASFIFVQKSEMFGDLNCTAARLHQKGELVKIQLMIAPDYARRSDFERILIQQVCNIK